MRKINVAVLMGGRTAEHDISLATGTMVVNNLNRGKYRVKPVVISRDGRWHVAGGYPERGHWPTPGRRRFVPVGKALTRLLEEPIDCVFIAMHGPHGEDGTIQGMMEILGLPYTGSDVCASALAMDKVKAKEIYRHHGILTPDYVVADSASWERRRKELCALIRKRIGYPCIIKPARLGSSVGSAICPNESELLERIHVSFSYGREVLIEKLVSGREVTCAVLDSPARRPPTALPPTEIVPRTRGYFDYHAKYTPGATAEITPAHIGSAMTRKVQELALRAHAALGCSGMSRTDMIMHGKTVYVLETNTIPGMTKTSLLPQAAKAAGLSFARLLDRIITVAISTHRIRRSHSLART